MMVESRGLVVLLTWLSYNGNISVTINGKANYQHNEFNNFLQFSHYYAVKAFK